MSKREDIASNIITAISTGTSPITLKKVTREPFNVDELSEQQYPACFVQSGNETRSDQTISFTSALREAKQLPTKPDLFFSGKMLSNMTQKSSPTQAQVYFTAIREGLKAMGNQRKRKFFAIGDNEAPLLKNKFMEEYTKLSRL